MKKKETSSPAIATFAVVALSAAVSAGGLLLPNLYRDNAFVSSLWVANDLITLVLAVPLLVASVCLAVRGSKIGMMLWLGMMDYMAYNYAFYLFAAAFNWFFIPYVVLFGASLATMVLLLIGLDASRYSVRPGRRFAPRAVGSYLAFIAITLCGIYLSQYVEFILSGRLPSIIPKTGHPTNVVFALDLTTVVPILILSSVLLWKGRPWGTILAGMILTKAVVYHVVLTAASFYSSRNGFPESAQEIPIWVFLAATELIALIAVARTSADAKKDS